MALGACAPLPMRYAKDENNDELLARPVAENYEYRLGPGDRLSVKVFGQSDVSGEFEIATDGSVSMPLVGQVPALNRTVGEFRDMVTNINGEDFTPAAVGQYAEFNFNYTLNANWNANEMYTLVWVQRPSDKEVLNSGTRFDPVVSATGEPAAQNIRILPNPVTDVATAQIGDDTARQIEVFAGNGQRISVDVESTETGTVNIPTAEFRPGIYFVKISGEKGVYVAKMVKN